MPTVSTSLGELVAEFYATFLDLWGDPELAAVATAAVVQDLLSRPDLADPDARVDEAA
jgi:hypothetical protein